MCKHTKTSSAHALQADPNEVACAFELPTQHCNGSPTSCAIDIRSKQRGNQTAAFMLIPGTPRWSSYPFFLLFSGTSSRKDNERKTMYQQSWDLDFCAKTRKLVQHILCEARPEESAGYLLSGRAREPPFGRHRRHRVQDA